MKLLPHLRASDRLAFRRWFNRQNTIRTRIIGWILLTFALINTLASLLGYETLPAYIYLSYGVCIAAGLTGSHLGMMFGYRRTGHLGEWVVLATAVVWMFHAVATNLGPGHGLAELVIGTLALAIFRGMHPALACATFVGFAIVYATLLWHAELLAYGPLINATVACAFAIAWSWSSYRNRIIEFHAEQMVRQLHVQNRELHSLALRDELTGLPNRRYFNELTRQHWGHRERQQQPMVLILADIDHFKDYNDRHGHPRGDACLQQVADLIRKELRAGGVAIRFGGEEFAILLRNISVAEATEVADRIMTTVERHTDVTISCGIASRRPAVSSIADLYQTADMALYQAKQRGRNQAVAAAADAVS